MSASRIVCLAAEIPEILFHLGALDQVVGISAYTTRPQEVLDRPKVSGFQHGSVDRILATRPDVVILTSDVQKPLAAALQERGVDIVHFFPHRLDDVFKEILTLGDLLEKPSQAEQLNERLQNQINDIAASASSFAHRPTVYFEEWMDPLLCGTGWVSDLIDIAGGKDVFRERSIHGKKSAQRVVLPEEVIAHAPEVILASWCGKPFKYDEFSSRLGFSDLPAVRNHQVFEMDSSILQCGPMLIDSLRQLHQLLRDAAVTS
ncbi:cobalamin-binding protein [Sulfoacidibacillus ferrooxidans]|uniref:Vitamin B12-binding protein n=1 Tax=Sulfoacidibacillus ferrooxidans TaxID=2005001 RepID=A0A9X2ADY4_9BACL|nr:cobalamin-binding protein [Sulfoacidibacillus ferrooxidans]MCI0182576.1 Vitamin B12-binding protein [Sulfoacidibacillus ferrooxidans]